MLASRTFSVSQLHRYLSAFKLARQLSHVSPLLATVDGLHMGVLLECITRSYRISQPHNVPPFREVCGSMNLLKEIVA